MLRYGPNANFTSGKESYSSKLYWEPPLQRQNRQLSINEKTT